MSLMAETRFGAIALFTLAAVACGDDSDTSGPSGSMDPGTQANRAPIASISASPTTTPVGDNHQTVVTLDGSGSTDPDGDELSFTWTVPSGQFVQGTSATATVAKVTFPGTSPYTVTLRVTDGRGGSDSESVVISPQ